MVKEWKRTSKGDTLSGTYPDRRYVAALAVTLVDLAQRRSGMAGSRV